MSRINKLAPDQWTPELRQLFSADQASELELGTMRIFAHCPEIAKGIIALGAGIQADSTLPARLIELVRLRIAFHNQCRSCLAIRYQSAIDSGVNEELICSLDNPPDADDLTLAEKAALHYADTFACNHLAIDDEMFKQLREYFNENQLVELGSWVAFCVGFGRLGAVWDMTEELPDEFQKRDSGPISASSGNPIIVR